MCVRFIRLLEPDPARVPELDDPPTRIVETGFLTGWIFHNHLFTNVHLISGSRTWVFNLRMNSTRHTLDLFLVANTSQSPNLVAHDTKFPQIELSVVVVSHAFNSFESTHKSMLLFVFFGTCPLQRLHQDVVRKHS